MVTSNDYLNFSQNLFRSVTSLAILNIKTDLLKTVKICFQVLCHFLSVINLEVLLFPLLGHQFCFKFKSLFFVFFSYLNFTAFSCLETKKRTFLFFEIKKSKNYFVHLNQVKKSNLKHSDIAARVFLGVFVSKKHKYALKEIFDRNSKF